MKLNIHTHEFEALLHKDFNQGEEYFSGWAIDIDVDVDEMIKVDFRRIL